MRENLTKKYLDDLTYEIIGAAIEVHKILGPGLLESIYHKCLMHELKIRGIEFQTEMPVPVIYKDFISTTDLRCDLFIEACILTELKAMDIIPPVHEVKVLSYMKFLEAPKGIMINFNVINIVKEGQKTYVNELYRYLPNL